MKNRVISVLLAFALVFGLVFDFGGVFDKKFIKTAGAATNFSKGCILSTSVEPTIFDALEILKFIVKMPNVINRGGKGSRAWKASLIMADSVANGEPNVFDALEILKYIVCMSNRIGVNPRPSTPRNLRAETSDGQIKITWTAPQSVGRSAIKHYQVSRNGTSWANVNGTSYTFTGLVLGASYTLLVRAVNSTHTGSYAAVTAAAKKPLVKPNFWHSDANYVSYWGSGNIYVSTQDIGMISQGFNLASFMDYACSQWNPALGVNVSRTTSANANIKAYGGRKAALEAQIGEPLGTAIGRTYYSGHRVADTLVIDGVSRQILKYAENDTRVYIVDRGERGMFTPYLAEQAVNTVTHELGHALGYNGHPARIPSNEYDVMWWQILGNVVLGANEQRHLRQVYDYYMG